MKTFLKSFEFNPVIKLKDYFLGRYLAEMAKKHIESGKPQLAIFAFDYIGNSINLSGRFESEELEVILLFLAPLHADFKNGVCLDVGANIGNHSVFYSDFFKSVHSFEPSPRIYSILNLNASLCNNVVTHNFGLASTKRQAQMNLTLSNVGESSIVPNWKSNNSSSAEKIELETLDNIAKSISDIKFIKIDVEGFEEEVLRGAEDTLLKLKPVICFEQHLNEFDENETSALRFLRSLDYDIYPLMKLRTSGGYFTRVINFFVKFFVGSQYTVAKSDFLSAQNYSSIIAIHKTQNFTQKSHKDAG